MVSSNQKIVDSCVVKEKDKQVQRKQIQGVLDIKVEVGDLESIAMLCYVWGKDVWYLAIAHVALLTFNCGPLVNSSVT